MRESDLVAQILDVAARLPWLCLWRNHRQAGLMASGNYSTTGLCRGASDLIGLVRYENENESPGYGVGRFVALECKSGRGRLSAAQRAFIERVQDMGGMAECVRELDDIIPCFEEYGPSSLLDAIAEVKQRETKQRETKQPKRR
jgi:VRR-NUC domain-containing protein